MAANLVEGWMQTGHRTVHAGSRLKAASGTVHMGTIITIHGTNATGPEQGEHWWQKGSDFERDVRDYVEAEDGKLDFRPFIWDGKNSETSRRHAGIRLVDYILKLNKNNESCIAIGHSHGGSIIANGLLWLSKKYPKPISCLSMYITVGTPFVHGRRKYLLYSRLGLAGQAAYMGLLFILCNQLWASFSLGGGASGAPSVALYAFLAILFFHLFAHFVERKSFYFEYGGAANRSYSALWLGINHKNDEAIHGLKALEKSKFSIFGKRFAVEWLSSAAALFIPVYFLLNILYEEYLKYIVIIPALNIMRYIYGPVSHFIRRFLPEEGIFIHTLVSIEIVAFFIFAALLFVGLSRVCAIFISVFFSGALNRLIFGQIKQNTFGSDAMSEVAVGTMRKPFWIDTEYGFLPDECGDELAKFADEASVKSVSKLRTAIGELSFSSMDISKTDSIFRFLTWDELIHTIYFKVPIFRKLVCYAIAHSPGFRPSEKLRNDLDYQKLGRWLEEIKPE